MELFQVFLPNNLSVVCMLKALQFLCLLFETSDLKAFEAYSNEFYS